MLTNPFFFAFVGTFLAFLLLCLFFWLTVKSFDQAIDLASRSLGFQFELLEEYRRIIYTNAMDESIGFVWADDKVDEPSPQFASEKAIALAREFYNDKDFDSSEAPLRVGTFIEKE